MEKYKIGDIVSGCVTGIESYGVFVKIDEHYNGMIHISEISDKFVNDIKGSYVIGDILKAMVIEIIEDKKQLKLSIKSIKENDSIDKSLNGFEPLANQLPIWVDKKMKEINANKKTS